MTDLNLSDLVERALMEDLGAGDVTTESCIPADAEGKAVLTAQGTGILSGMAVQDPLFSTVTSIYRAECSVGIEDVKGDGKPVFTGEPIVNIEGSIRVILALERTLLNFLQHLSGIATETSRYVSAVRGTNAKITDTRKTTPGMRVLEKQAVQHGGGHNHRIGLYDGVLIKDNHIASAGGVTAAIRAAQTNAPHTLKIEVECETFEQIDEAIAANVDMILLDNMPVAMLHDAVRRADGRCLLEASGGITLANVREVADTGVDFISVGAITHSAPILPMHLEMDR